MLFPRILANYFYAFGRDLSRENRFLSPGGEYVRNRAHGSVTGSARRFAKPFKSGPAAK
jgi:hypothetical protein